MTALEPSIDFEFRSGTDIALGLERYFADPEAEVLCMSWDMQDGLGVRSWHPRLLTTSGVAGERGGQPRELLDHVARGGKVRGWNVIFEWYAWNRFCVPLYGWPPLQLSQLVDTMAEAAAMNMPQALGRCAVALRLPADQQKDKRGKELIKLLCCPQPQPAARTDYKTQAAVKGAETRHRHWQERGGRWINDPELLAELYRYCDQDVATEAAVARKLRRLSEYERRVWLKTQEMNQRGVPIDTVGIEAILRIVAAEHDRLNDELRVLTDFAVRAGTEAAALRRWINARHPKVIRLRRTPVDASAAMLGALAEIEQPEEYEEYEDDLLADMEAGTLTRALLEHAETMSQDVRRAIQIRLAVAQTSIKKLRAMLQRVVDGVIRGMYVYHGASTGRDASRGGVNLQNVVSPIFNREQIALALEVFLTGDHGYAAMMYGEQLMDAAVSLVRAMIAAPGGYEFYDADFSSVENRVSAWIAGQHDKLELFRTGTDEYRVFGSYIFHCTPEEITPEQRKFSKPGVLGGMFGQGWRGLIDYAAGMGVKLTPEDSQRITTLYRSLYQRVQASWYRFGDVSIEAVKNPGKWFDTGRDEFMKWDGTMAPALPFGRVAMMYRKNHLWVRLPSGRLISWAQPKVEWRLAPWGKYKEVVTVEQEDGVTLKWRRDPLIGSSIFQSVVQATARDILIHGAFNVEDAGYAVVMRTHDELTTLVPSGFGSPEHFGELMCSGPSWCVDLPLAFEAWAAPRFRK